jgi:hypothetical protein
MDFNMMILTDMRAAPVRHTNAQRGVSVRHFSGSAAARVQVHTYITTWLVHKNVRTTTPLDEPRVPRGLGTHPYLIDFPMPLLT